MAVGGPHPEELERDARDESADGAADPIGNDYGRASIAEDVADPVRREDRQVEA